VRFKESSKVKLHVGEVETDTNSILFGTSGGAVVPDLGRNIQIMLSKEQTTGIRGFRPVQSGSFNIDIYGNTRGFRALGEYFLALADLDASEYPGYHDHFSKVTNAFGDAKINLTVRKNSQANPTGSGFTEGQLASLERRQRRMRPKTR
jgi:hypothetical protein